MRRSLRAAALSFGAVVLALALALTASGGKRASTITVWAMGAEGDKLDQIAKDFMAKNPSIKVNVTPVSWDVAHDKIITSIAGQKTPDVSLIGTTWMAEFAETGALDKAPRSISKGAYFPGAWTNVVVKGSAYGVPWYVETRVLYYRTDIAKKAGIKHAPQTWTDLKAMAKAMEGKGGAKYGIALAPNNWQELLPFIWQDGGQVADSKGHFKLDSKSTVDALSFEKWFFDKGLTAKSVPQGFDVTQGFITGTHPMFFSGPWHLALIKDQGGAKLKGKWAIAMMPKKVTRTSFLGGGDLVVFKNSKNKDAAWKFVKYLSQPAVQAKWFTVVGDLPAVRSGWSTGKLASDPYLAVFKKQLGDAKPPPVLPKWEEVASQAINTEMEKVLTGRESPQQGARQMQKKAKSISG